MDRAAAATGTGNPSYTTGTCACCWGWDFGTGDCCYLSAFEERDDAGLGLVGCFQFSFCQG